jgi:uncharacterized Zn ribbon protein
MFQHACIKCQTKYSDADPEPYYCPSCNEQRKLIAQEVDKKMAHRPQTETKSDLQLYDEVQKQSGNKFISSKIFGI